MTATLRIYDAVGGPIWIAEVDGQKVYEQIIAAFKAGRGVQLSFANRQELIPSFLNAAIGQLYNGDYSEEFLSEHLSYVDITDEDRAKIARSTNNARRYFANPRAFEAAWKEEVGEDEE